MHGTYRSIAPQMKLDSSPQREADRLETSQKTALDVRLDSSRKLEGGS